MLKKGYFGLYKGKEYEITEDMENNLLIMTEDSSLIDDGFVDTYNSNVYTKIVKPNDLSQCYLIKPIAVYKGYKFNVSTNEKENKVCLGTPDATLADKMNFERTDKYYYEKWVHKSEVELAEDKKEIDPMQI